MSSPRSLKLVSVVIPIFNERPCLAELVWRLDKVFGELGLSYDVIFVDDASTDGSFSFLQEIALKNPAIRGIRFSKNRGQQTAWGAGLELAVGDVVIMMDGDLQHPPELIPDMLSAWYEGFDIVNTEKQGSVRGSWWRDWLSAAFYTVFNSISDELKLGPGSSDFRLLDQKCVRALNQCPERLKFYRGLVEYIGFRSKVLLFTPPARHAGHPKFTLRQSFSMAFDAMTNFSTIGLKLPLFLGAFIFLASAGYFAGALIVEALTGNGLVRGWPSVIALSTIFFGAQFFFLGIIGLYVGKMFTEMKRRPAYFVSDSVPLRENHLAASAQVSHQNAHA